MRRRRVGRRILAQRGPAVFGRGALARAGPILAVGLVVLAACAGEPEGWEVPDGGPHEAYVARVLEELTAIHAETLDELVSEEEITAEVRARLEATFTAEESEQRRLGLANVLANDLEGFAGGDGPRPVAVRSLAEVTPDCVLAETDVSLPSGVGEFDPPEGASVVVELRRVDVDARANPTGWVIAREEFVPDGDPRSVPGCR